MPGAESRFDAAVDRAVDGVRNPTLDHVFYALSAAADHSKLWHGLAWVRGLATGRTDDARRMSTALGIESFVTNVVVKSAIGRLRPARPATDGPLPYGMRVPITSSFPSGSRHRGVHRGRLPLRRRRPLAPLWYGLAGSGRLQPGLRAHAPRLRRRGRRRVRARAGPGAAPGRGPALTWETRCRRTADPHDLANPGARP